jgi:hypothetical protein
MRAGLVVALMLAGCAGAPLKSFEPTVGAKPASSMYREPNGSSRKAFLTLREDAAPGVGEDDVLTSPTSPAPAPAPPRAPRAKARQSAPAPAAATIVACPACPACPGCPACPACPMAVPCPAPPEPKKTPWWADMLKVLGGAAGMGAVAKLATYLRADTT